MIAVSCPCGWSSLVKDQFAGMRIKCPQCGNKIQVPGQLAAATQPTATPADMMDLRVDALYREINAIHMELGTRARKMGPGRLLLNGCLAAAVLLFLLPGALLGWATLIGLGEQAAREEARAEAAKRAASAAEAQRIGEMENARQ